MLVGLVGQIGTGKSEVARILKNNHGAYIISADKIGRDVVDKSPAVLKKLVNAFGPEILSKTGRLRRKYLGRLAFATDDGRAKLNRIVHPPLLKELTVQVKEAQKKHDLVVIDAALLIDWGWDKKVDFTILVHAGDKIKISRLVKKGLSIEEARMRIKSQLPYRELRKYADFVIFNNRSVSHLQHRIDRILEKLTGKGLTSR